MSPRTVSRARSLARLLATTWVSGRLQLLLISGLVIVAGVAPVAVTAATSAIANAMASGRSSGIAIPSIVLAISLVMAGVLAPFTLYLTRSFARRARRTALDSVYAAVTAFPTLEPYERPGFYDRISLALTAAMTGPNVILNVGSALMAQGTTLVGFVLIVAGIDMLYAGLLLAAVVPSLVAESIIGGRRARLAAETSPLERRRTFFTSLMLDRRAAQEVRLFALGGFLRRRMREAQVTADAREANHDRRVLTLQVLYTGVAASAVAFAVWHAAVRATRGELEVGAVVVLSGALLSLQMSAGTVVEMMGELNRTAVLFAEYLALISTAAAAPAGQEVADQETGGAPAGVGSEPAIAFDDVSFAYPGMSRQVLRNVSFTVDVGETVALVGPNGSGKSTIVKLIAGLYLPQAGVVSCNGEALTLENLAAVRSSISVLFQDFVEYDLTARENITIGDLPSGELQRYHDTVAAAGLADVFSELPEGDATLLSKSFGRDDRLGSDLSQGQWQKIALARALYRVSHILILDEPSAWLDAQSEADLIRTVRATDTATKLIVSHRLGLTQSADRIVVLDSGKIVAVGPHHKLLEGCDLYRDMWLSQVDVDWLSE